MARICVFGDSISYGAWDYEQGGWVQRLRRFLDRKFIDSEDYFVVYNLGIDGDATKDLLKRFEFEAPLRMLRMSENEETIIIFEIGVNDACFVESQKEFMTELEKFEENLQELSHLARSYSLKIVFIGLTPVEEIKVTPLPWSKTGKSYKNEYIRKYNEIIKSVCTENKIYFIEIFEKWIELDYKNLLEDGLHPNSKGHEKIFEIVKDFLIKNKIIILNFGNSGN
ncbi:hypothetical protein KAS79_03830 [Candidatus Parcubacteria bacterium]|nr:hypothetical protein [Candidatus Parcubacteria bacterium]